MGKIMNRTTDSITDDELENINKLANRKYSASDLYVFDAILCDNELDKDNEAFSLDALKQLRNLFVGKTGIVSSDPAENLTARIFACEIETLHDRKTSYGDIYYCLVASIYIYVPINESTQTLIHQIESSIKKEISIGCSVGIAKKYTIIHNVLDVYDWALVHTPEHTSRR